MPTLAQAETTHFARLDAAYQRALDDYDQQAAMLGLCQTLADLDRYGFEPTLLDSQLGFGRYQINMGAGDDDKYWICSDCGSIAMSHLSGCQSCGFGTEAYYEGEDEQEAEAA